MVGRVGGPWASRPRALMLVVLAVASVADLASYAVLAGHDDGPRRVSPSTVARTVTQAVADGDCDDLDRLLADDAELPWAVTACLRGDALAADLTGVTVVDAATTGATSAVTVGLTADGQDGQVVVDLRLVDGRWLVTGIRAAA